MGRFYSVLAALVLVLALCAPAQCYLPAVTAIVVSPNHARPGDQIMVTTDVRCTGSFYTVITCNGHQLPSPSWSCQLDSINSRYRTVYAVQSSDGNGAATIVATLYINGTPYSSLTSTTALYVGNPPANHTYYVKTTGSDGNNGLSWNAPKATIQAAITAASAGDEVWVGAGSYTISSTITLKEGVRVYGGFPSDGGDWSQRDVKTNKTQVLGYSTLVTANSGVTPATLLDGFILLGASSYGVNCNTGSPTIANNLAAKCATGIRCYQCRAVVRGNTLRADTTGIDASCPTTGTGALLVQGNVCMGCTRGIYLSSTAAGVVVVNNTLAGCATGIQDQYGTPRIINNIICFNDRGIYRYNGTPVLRYNCVYGNYSLDYSNVSPGTGDVSYDPYMVTDPHDDTPLSQTLPVDPHLTYSSSCETSGDATEQYLPYWDMDNATLASFDYPHAGADDVGYYYYTPLVIYVKPASEGGSNGNDGSSWNYAKATITAGVDAVAPYGGEVRVKSGTYAERGIATCPYTRLLGSYSGNGDDRTPTNYSSIINPGSKAGYILSAASCYTPSIVDGFAITNGTGGISCGGSTMISNNYIYGNDSYGFSGGGNGSIIARNRIVHNNSYGVQASSGGTTVIKANWINDNAGMGIYVSTQAAAIVSNELARNTNSAINAITFTYNGALFGIYAIENNTIVYNTSQMQGQGGGIYLSDDGTGDFTGIKNNIFAHNSPYAIYKSSATNLGTQNDFWANDGILSWGSPPPNCLYVDPKFVSDEPDEYESDFHLLNGSPCIDVANQTISPNNTIDIDGQPRAMDGTYCGQNLVDIGADEYGRVLAPYFSPASGIYDYTFYSYISCDTPGATIRYTTNGTEPNAYTYDLYKPHSGRSTDDYQGQGIPDRL